MAKRRAANPSAASGSSASGAAKPAASGTRARKARARDLGIPLPGTPGPLNAITDVAGVEVGHATLIEGAGPLVVGKGPVRTGVTAILPRGKESRFRLRRLRHTQRQWRDDGHRLGRGVGVPVSVRL